SRDTVMRVAVKPAYFVPKSVKADVLFRNMKHSHNSLAVVLDEYGGVIGIITINDLVEQLVGDLGDAEPL
ncbi:MAG: CBS domain-containing protein, partial [Oscillospiraceae bacterium]